MDKLNTRIKLLDKNASVPVRAHDSDTGYDLKMIALKTIVGDTMFFSTGISIQPPEGHYFEVVPRSSISKFPFALANSVGIIDEHYRGEILVPIRVYYADMGKDQGRTTFPGGIINFMNKKPRNLYERAQIILADKPILTQLILKKRLDTEFEIAEELSDTERADGGFGSTDNKEAPSLEQTITKSTSRKGMVRRSSEE